MAEVTCPSCAEVIRHSDRFKVGQAVHCQYCDERLIVLQLNPVVLEWPDSSDWEADNTSSKKTAARIDTEASISQPDFYWYEDADWETGDRNWRSMTKKSRKKKRDQRHVRRRRSRDELYWDY